MLDSIVKQAPFFLLIAVRCFALIMTLPLFAMRSTVPRVVKVALAGYFAYLVFPQLSASTSFFYKAYNSYFDYDGSFTLEYILLLVGEALIGIIMGLYVSIIFAHETA